MKNIEINTKAVKKIFAAGLLVLTMTGCGGNTEPVKDNKPTGEKTEEKEENKTGFNYVEMSEKETKDLVAGDFIQSEDGKTITIPDRDLLESLGYDFEYEVECLYGVKGETLKSDGVTYYFDNAINNAISYEYEENGKEMECVYKIKGIHIINIIGAYEENGVFMKEVKCTNGGIMAAPLTNQENYDKLPHTGEVSYSYVNKKATL